MSIKDDSEKDTDMEIYMNSFYIPRSAVPVMWDIIKRLANWNTADLVERNMLVAEAEILINQLNKE